MRTFITPRLTKRIRALYRASAARLGSVRSELRTLKIELLTTCGYGQTGCWGERIAARHIERAGALVLAKNWFAGKLEADIIAIDKRTLVVIEVKTRHKSLMSTFPAHNAVTGDKIRRLSTLAHAFIRRHGPLCRRLGVRNYRLDTIEVYYQRSSLKRHLRQSVSWHKSYTISTS
jgi:putative endonuclease